MRNGRLKVVPKLADAIGSGLEAKLSQLRIAQSFCFLA